MASAKKSKSKKAPAPAKADIGHNSGINKTVLKSVVNRLVNLEDEKEALGDDIKEIMAEAKGVGLKPKVIRRIVKDTRSDREKLREFKDELEAYAFIIDPDLAEVLS